MSQSGKLLPQNCVDRRGNLFYRSHPVHLSDQSTLLIVRQDRRSLCPIFGHPRPNRCFIVVGAAFEVMAPADVAGARNLGEFVLVMIRRTAVGAAEAAGDPLHQRILVDLKLDHVNEFTSAFGEEQVEGFCLCACARPGDALLLSD